MRVNVIRIFNVLGIFTPLALFFSITLANVFWPDYNFITEYVSVLGSDYSPFQTTVNIFGFGLFGIIMAGVALVVSETLKPSNLALRATRLFLTGGIMVSILAFIPSDRGYADSTFSGKIHSLIGLIAFFSVLLSVFWHARVFRSEEQWGRLWTIISNILGLIGLTAGLSIVLNPTFYFNGAIERVGIGVTLIWIFLVSVNCFFIDKFYRIKT